MSRSINLRFNPEIGERIFIHYGDNSLDMEEILEFDDIEKAEEKLSELHEKEQESDSCGVYIRAIIKGIELDIEPVKTVTKVRLKEMEVIKDKSK